MEPLAATADLFSSLAESLVKTDLYDVFMTEVLGLGLEVCVRHHLRTRMKYVIAGSPAEVGSGIQCAGAQELQRR